MELRRKIIVILGPTSSGKSALAIRLARQFNGEIISADSRQIYRGMDIGTGKVTKAEQKLAKHWLLDIASPSTDYNAAKFKKTADKIIADILRRGKLPILCGGTGFWIKAIVDNVIFPEVKPNKALRNKLNKRSAAALFKMLKKLDRRRAKDIDRHNKVRLIRAIEICRAIGSVPQYKPQTAKYDFLQIGLVIPKKKLQQNIQRRLKKRFAQGMIAEVKKLHHQGVSWKHLEMFGLEYKWIALYFQKKISAMEMQEKLLQEIKNYAKRQMTWFKKDKRIVWLKNYKKIKDEIKKFLSPDR